MFTRRSKIKKANKQEPSVLEDAVAQALYDLQVSSEKLKPLLADLYITAAKEVDLGDNKKAVLVFVPVPQLARFQKLIRDNSLLEELEKKFSGKLVGLLAERKIVQKESRKEGARAHKQLRPRSRTLTAVHESILEELVFPVEIVGKRLRFKQDGSRLLKVHLQADKTVGDKLSSFSKIYKSLTSKDVEFQFPSA